MTDEDLKKIGDEFERALKPVYEDLDQIKNDVGGIKKELQEVTENVDALRGDVAKLQDDVKGIRVEIGFKTQRNKREIDEIKTHLGLPIMADMPE
jgi:predicted  nucleic acid-binding Zn-ribbon protein